MLTHHNRSNSCFVIIFLFLNYWPVLFQDYRQFTGRIHLFTKSDYKPVMFLDYKPKWEHLSIDPSFTNYDSTLSPADQFAYSNIYIREGRMFASYNLWEYFLDFFLLWSCESWIRQNGMAWYFLIPKEVGMLIVKLTGEKLSFLTLRRYTQLPHLVPWWSIGIPQ